MQGRKPFSNKIINQVWEKATEIDGEDPKVKRKDFKNREIARAAYGDRNSSFGWDIHHLDENKNNNDLGNLIPVHYDTHNELHED